MSRFTTKEAIMAKIITFDQLKGIPRGDIVFTNGCYDLIHAGHVLNFQDGKKLGKRLVVGLNSDESMRRIKHEPLVEEAKRVMVVAAFECVDHVIVFDEDTPCKVIEELKPDLYVKGGDYTLETINQDVRRSAEKIGADIVFVPFLAGYSTATLIRKMQAVTLPPVGASS